MCVFAPVCTPLSRYQVGKAELKGRTMQLGSQSQSAPRNYLPRFVCVPWHLPRFVFLPPAGPAGHRVGGGKGGEPCGGDAGRERADDVADHNVVGAVVRDAVVRRVVPDERALLHCARHQLYRQHHHVTGGGAPCACPTRGGRRDVLVCRTGEEDPW